MANIIQSLETISENMLRKATNDKSKENKINLRRMIDNKVKLTKQNKVKKWENSDDILINEPVRISPSPSLCGKGLRSQRDNATSYLMFVYSDSLFSYKDDWEFKTERKWKTNFGYTLST